MKIISPRVLLVLLSIKSFACGGPGLPTEPPDGWAFLYPPERFTSGNLYEYINGAAELYLRYDVVEVQTAVYVCTDDSSLTYTADLYIFSEPLCAFGIYSYYRRAESTVTDIGNEAVVSAMSVRFWQDRCYVNLVAGSTDARMDSILPDAARALSAKLPSAPPPRELSLLPQEYRLPNSLKYHHRNYLQIEGLNRVIEGEYHGNGANWTAFVVLCPTKELQEASGMRLKEIPAVIFQNTKTKNYVAGVHHITDLETALAFLQRIGEIKGD